jgi:hypothetical protein
MTGLDYEAAAIAFAGVRSSQTFTPQQDDHLARALRDLGGMSGVEMRKVPIR